VKADSGYASSEAIREEVGPTKSLIRQVPDDWHPDCEETAELLDEQSRPALCDTASTIQEIPATEPTAVFEIEGHTSVEGAEEFNLKLSGERAKRVFDELTTVYNVPATALTAKGYGEQYVRPADNAARWPLDRRVLVVRVK
jgi:outer membrane protein OmpA-like peptidoglycan-associated protein